MTDSPAEAGAAARARALLVADRAAEAREVLEGALANAPRDPSLHELLAEALLALRRPRLAAEAAARAIADGGETARRRVLLGRGLNNAGDLAGAEQAFRAAARLEPGSADVHAFLGHVLRSRGHHEEAEGELVRALESDPGHPRALVGLGTLRLGAGRVGDATALLRRAVDADPAAPGGWNLLGAALHRAGETRAAEDAYRRALEIAPGFGPAWLNLGITLQDTGRLDDSVDAYRKAVRHAPLDPAPLQHLAQAMLAAGEDDEALDAADRLLEVDPGSPSGLAVRALALHRLGREAEAASLLDFDRLVRPVRLPAPEGYASVAEFNSALVEHVLGHPTLAFEPAGHATRKGSHTRDLLAGEKGPAGGLEKKVIEAVDEYLGALSLEPDHPFPGPVPPRRRLTMWAVVMEGEGHQLPHIHPGAWLSGVYYPELPAEMAGRDDHAGWIEFGLPPEELERGVRPPVRLYRPEVGLMLLFPSYFYHRTIPFPGPSRRISVAFDVLRPVGGVPG